MAKKKESLFFEERLEKALVPDWEQPYKVPSNWVWIRLLEAFDNKTSSNKKIPQNQYLETGEYSIVDQGKTLIGGYSNNENFLYEGNLPVIVFGDHTRCIKYIDFPFIQGADGVKVLSAKNIWNSKCFYYALQNVEIVDMGYRRHFPLFNKFAIALPPLAEQQRIVDRIESVFSKLDEAKEKAQQALDSFETRKAAILHKAFTGELTQKWREENGVGLDSWTNETLNTIGFLERGKSKHRPRNDERLFGGEFPFVQTGDIARADVYVIEHKQCLSEFGLKQSKLFKKGTLCITIAANIGDVAILSYDCCFPDSVVAFTPNEKSLSKYVYYKMLTLQDDIEANAPATAQKNINLKILSEIIFSVPSLPEQTEIVRILDSIFEKEKQAKERASVIEKIDLMKKAILARAFRGELGTNDPEEESAVELLKEILKEA